MQFCRRAVAAALLLSGCSFGGGDAAPDHFSHRVGKGETLYSIGERFDVSPYELRAINRISDPRKIAAGQVIKVPNRGGEMRGRYEPRSAAGGTGGEARGRFPGARPKGLREIPLGAAKKHVGALAWPLPGGVGRFTSNFNWRGRGFHEGIDIAAPYGTPVFAAHAGRVAFAGRRGGYGNMVVVRGDGIMTVYGHHQRLLVRRGDAVSRGQRVAEVGATGHATGPHLHYEIRIWDSERKGFTAVEPRAFYR